MPGKHTELETLTVANISYANAVGFNTNKAMLKKTQLTLAVSISCLLMIADRKEKYT